MCLDARGDGLAGKSSQWARGRSGGWEGPMLAFQGSSLEPEERRSVATSLDEREREQRN